MRDSLKPDPGLVRGCWQLSNDMTKWCCSVAKHLEDLNTRISCLTQGLVTICLCLAEVEMDAPNMASMACNNDEAHEEM